MKAKEIIYAAMRSQGKNDALALRYEADSLTGTQIIAREDSIPAFDPGKDYSKWPAMSPVADGGQVWLLLQPYNAANHPGRPGELRALWGIAHTTDPEKAKEWVAPLGTSGLWYKGECYRDGTGTVKRCIAEQTSFSAAEVPEYWEDV